jgi:predicted nuclease of predicted toxin-antitoxin system
MKFLIDAQLPPSLKQVFVDLGFDSLHTLDVDLKNETPDKIINQISVSEKRIVLTKDSDFLDSFLLKQAPYKLVLVKLGNMSKNDLINFFRENISSIVEKLKTEDLLLLKKE